MFKKAKKRTLLRLMEFIKSRWITYIFGLIGISCFNLGINYVAALGLKSLTDGSINHDMGMVRHSIFIMGAGYAAGIMIAPLFMYMFSASVKKTTGDIRKALFDHIQNLPVKLLEDSHSGDFISRLNNDVQTAENAYGGNINMLLSSIVSGVGSGIIIAVMSPELAVTAVLIGLIGTLADAAFAKPIKRASTKVQESFSQLVQKLSDMISGGQVIRLFGIQKKTADKYSDANEIIKKWSMKRVILNSYLSGVNTLVGFLSFAGFIGIGCILTLNKRITFGTLIAIVQMANGLSWMFSSIGTYITQIQTSLAGADRIFEVMDMPQEDVKNSVEDRAIEDNNTNSPAIEFKDVGFSYEENNMILNGFNLSIKRDEVVAIVGPSGSGKSTLFKILLGFYRPSSGHINIFGKPAQEYPARQLREMFAYVPQDSYLFSGTIAENIGYGRIGACRDEIIEAAKAAYAHDFIMEFPDGYDTQVGERGARLSGGQRQRIAIARALLKDAPILLLDEATSSLDSGSEGQVQKALDVLMKGRTTIVIAHRLSTIRDADRILVFEDGSIVEEGSHESLMAMNNAYARLYKMQFQQIS